MSKKGLLFLAATYLLLTFAGGSKGQLQLSVDTSHFAATNFISLNCYVQNNNRTASSTSDQQSGMEMHMMKRDDDRENESLQFKMNNSVIYPNSTFLHNYSVESVPMEMGQQYSIHFQLNSAFEGSFTCGRSNHTVSNDVILAYLPLVNMDINRLPANLDLAYPTQTVELCGDFGLIIGGSLSAAAIVIITMIICLTIACYRIKRRSSRAKNVKSLGSWGHSPMQTKSYPSSYWKDRSVVHFTANGYAVPKCSLAKLANERRPEKQHTIGTNNTKFISKRIISKVLKYLLHPSDCSRPNCLCKEVKGEYNALVNELKSDLDYYAPHNSTILTSEFLVEAQIEHELMQGRSQTQTTALTQGNDPIQCSAITIKDDDTLSSYCKDGCSSAPTLCDQSCIYYPQLSPVSPGPELELSYVDPVDRVTLDSKGGRYTNQDHDIYLIVPPGAVPEGQQVTVEIGVSLSCPILFPTGKRPVSAMVSMCVVGNPNYQFLKPVEVRLSHCLDIATKEDANNLEVEFLKSGHNLFCFHKAEGESTFEPGTHSGTLSTKHFCCFCIVANKMKADLTKTYYRLVKVVPKSTPSLRWKARYCITYFLSTCLRALEKQYNPQNYQIQSLRRFKFATNVSSEKPYIEIECKLEGSGWTLGLESFDRIYASDVDFWDIEPSELEEMETEELYPPRFVIEVCGTQAQSTGRASLDFSGMENEFKSELILDANRGSHQHSVHNIAPAFVSLQSQSEPALSIQSQPDAVKYDGPSDRDLMNKVAAVIPTKWKFVGLQLGLEHSQLEIIEQKQSCSVLRFCDVFMEWKKRRTSECSWSTITDALNSRLVGETALADKLKKEMEISSIDSGINTM